MYRAATLEVLGIDPRDELPWLNEISLKHIKNYQIWHHRQLLLERLAVLLSSPQKSLSHQEQGTKDSAASLTSTTTADTSTTIENIASQSQIREIASTSETAFLTAMLAKDAKNYHVWSYRQWLVRRFDLFSDPAELHRIESLLQHDIRNNSAWNHRWFLVFGQELNDKSFEISDAQMTREVEFVKAAIRKAPQNESSWNYLRGLTGKIGSGVLDEEDDMVRFAMEFADIERPEEVRSTHALNLLAEAWAEQGSSPVSLDKKENEPPAENGKNGNAQEGKVKAGAALDLLANKYDPIRANYWNYRKSLLGLDGGETVVV